MIEKAVDGEASYCPEDESKGCLHEQAFHMHVTPDFMQRYAKGGSFTLVSDERTVEVYVPTEMMVAFYETLKELVSKG